MAQVINAITQLLHEAILALDSAVATGGIDNARRAVADADRRRLQARGPMDPRPSGTDLDRTA